jgi:uncharacterized phage protein (TIGR02218 family)
MRNLPSDLNTHLQGSVTTTCRLLRFILKDARIFGMTTLDRDIDYDGVVYYGINGFDPSNIATDTGLSVDNSEVKALLSAEIPGITTQMVMAGELDDAEWEMLLVNWADLTMGHMIIDAGDVGEVKVVDDIVYMPELVSSTMRLRQSIGHVWSRSCRAIFGDPADGQLGCGIDATALWQAGVVTGIGVDARQVFADSSLLIDPAPIPGRVQWLTGNNTSSRIYQIEAYSSTTGTIGLLEPCAFDIVVGDTFRIREDCDKQPSTCKNTYDNWLNYKGEPLIPVGDGVAVLTPNAQIPGGFVGSEVV